ncbi:hypothetical protein PIGHUM_00727 [Pigmentiphaga humi]|uniref:Type II secretion system protein GspC N-terminal domain-containing protein n=1 Tax=Pigmentiphaga humi TaxID=2478468 RepID=A0A3P4AX82_9BURK|nr:hypothetical protein [Pigmentiphaga humi]VCU68669.1 hypothetical protein PIGHUM_00727 [Pigmentiphaga humi]
MRVSLSLPSTAAWLAMLAFAAGVGVWGAILFAPSPLPPPPAVVGGGALRTDTASVARWFGTGAGARIQVTVAGLIAAGPRGSAVLAIDGRPPRAYAVGSTLADGVTLAEVRGGGIVLDQGGERVEVAAAKLPPAEGIRIVK